MKEKSVRDKESRDLEMNKLSVEDVKARNEELARMKTLLFYQEQKNKRINKIKSKKYHKIRKRAEERREEKMREILKQTDPERYKELLEKDAVKRAKERMSLKHKNTSKVSAARAAEAEWIKSAQQGGGRSDAMARGVAGRGVKGSYSYGILLTELLARIVPFSDTYAGFDFINDVAIKNQLPTIPKW